MLHSVKIRVILISSVRPEPTSAGQIILHRHLVDQPGIELEVYGGEPRRFSLSMVLRRVLGKVAMWGDLFETAVNCLWVLWEGRWMDCDLPQHVPSGGKTVVMTVAHGEGFRAAQRFAKKHKLPLVVFFQDWWPDMAPVPTFFQRILEKQFLALATECSVGLCVCEGMRDALGGGENLQVLPPIPAKRENVEIVPRLERKPNSPFRVLYFGNLDFYGAMLGEAIMATRVRSEIELIVRGSNPPWTEEIHREFKESGNWLDFAPRAELEEWLASADAFLIPMVFDPKMRKRMETSFPSKLIEFAQFGKPLIIWGPEYCSAVRWAKTTNRTICVTQKNPIELVSILEEYSQSISKSIYISTVDRKFLKNEFDSFSIQVFFNSILSKLLL